MFKHKRLLLAMVGLLVPVAINGIVAAQAVTQGYLSDTPLEPGMIVELDTKNPNKVKPATQADISRIHGVVVAQNDAPVSLSSDQNVQQNYVATSGEYEVLVSDQNGAISKGDYISISSIAGVGMKAATSQTVVLGKALNDFDGIHNLHGTSPLTLGNGNKTNVHLGYVTIDISLSHNPLYQPTTSSDVPGVLLKFGQSIAGKQVSLARVYISLAVLVVTTVVAGGLLYAGIRNGMVALGRNPLARHTIVRGLAQIILTSLIVFMLGMFAVYLLLKL